ncbi:OprD family porin [Pseudomonas sp. X10]
MFNIKTGGILLTLATLHYTPISVAAFVEDQAASKGFAADSKLEIKARNYYFNRNKTHGAEDDKDWTQAFLGSFSSGYTQGLLGVGLDAFGYAGFKLDGSDKYSGSGNLVTDRQGRNQDQHGKAGLAAKVRISKTALKVGAMRPNAPVFAVADSRLLPQTATGISLQSSELKGLDLEAGHFTSGSSQDDTNHDGEMWATYAGVTTPTASYIGGRYRLTERMDIGVYHGHLEDVWDQYYGNVNYLLPLTSSSALQFDANYYHTADAGSEKAGDINNNTYALSVGYSFLSSHKVTLAYQKVNGDTPFDFIGFGDNRRSGGAIFLPNSIQYSDFNGPGEASMQVRYDLNMAGYGVPGLSFVARYVRGKDIDGTRMDPGSPYARFGYGEDGRHRETDVEVKYVVQSGPAKNLSIRVRQAWHRANADQAEGDLNDFRIITELPISIF